MRPEGAEDLEVLSPLSPASRPYPAVARVPRSAGPRWVGAAVLVGVFLAGLWTGRLMPRGDGGSRSCVVMRFGDAVTSPQIVSIFDAAESGSALALAGHDGHQASLLFASPEAAKAAAAAAEQVAEPQIGRTSSIRIRPWSACLQP